MKPPNVFKLKDRVRLAINREWSNRYPPSVKRKVEFDELNALIRHVYEAGFACGARMDVTDEDVQKNVDSCLRRWLDSELEDSGHCCAYETRDMDGGCVNCGAPCF